MLLTRHDTPSGPRWAVDGSLLNESFDLRQVLALSREEIENVLRTQVTAAPASGPFLPPLEIDQEVWASGVTYRRSRDAREAESSVGDVYTRVYDAERPELFLKAIGWRVVGDGVAVRIRADSTWDVPEPELTLVINADLAIIGYCAGNDMSSRSIEGENPLYLPQAKIYAGSCALGPGIRLAAADELRDLPIHLTISREGAQVFDGETSTAQMKRGLEELVRYLGRELPFPQGAFLMTGTGLVPPDDFTLEPGDEVRISVGDLTLTNGVERAAR